jgi:ClpA/ClpB-like protein/UvrB/UvrC motif-containing protein
MFERFTERARRAVVQAQVEARELRHNYIGTEHLLLGILHEEDGLAVHVLQSLDVDPAVLASDVIETVGRGKGELPKSGHIPFTPPAKKTMELALREALQLKHDYIGTEHLLLGNLREGDGVGARVLRNHGITLEAVRLQILTLLDNKPVKPATKTTTFRLRGTEASLIGDIHYQLAAISRRLAAIEAKLGIEDSGHEHKVRQLSAQLVEVRAQKEAAIEEQDFERASRLRDQERKLLAARHDIQRTLLAEESASVAAEESATVVAEETEEDSEQG